MKSNINIEKLKQIISDNLKDKSLELKRVFHGRGNFYDDYNYLVVDSINDVLLVCYSNFVIGFPESIFSYLCGIKL